MLVAMGLIIKFPWLLRIQEDLTFITSALSIHWKKYAKNVWNNVFLIYESKYILEDYWCIKVNTFWKIIQYSMHWNKLRMLQKISVTKNAHFFLLRAPTHHSFNRPKRLSFKLKQYVWCSKSMCENSLFRFRFLFIAICASFVKNTYGFHF